ncbi:MAG: TrmH family RNA methyltransferase [Polyangiaceae bacterium]|jgi:tRNA (guanosine-2'-O-)-methyltransferase
MRRTSAGVEGIAPRGHGEPSYDPEHVIGVLEPLATESRRARLRDVISRRLSSVAVVMDAPYDPHNGAAIIRSCEAFGVQTVHVVERHKTPFAVARAVARSAEKWVDVTCHKDVSSLLRWSADAHMPLVGAHPEGELAPDVLASMPRVAIVLGNERDGIRSEIARACTGRVHVPMRGFIESLNVSVTAALLVYAATKDRIGDLDPAAQRRLYARGLIRSVPHAEEILAR